MDEEEVPLAKGGGKGGCIGASDGDEEGAGEELGKVGEAWRRRGCRKAWWGGRAQGAPPSYPAAAEE